MRIKNFEQYIFESYSPLNEGGRVFGDDTRKINKDEVAGTISDIEERLFPSVGLNSKNIIKVGSAGHADVSGDIDFGVVGKDLEILKGILEMKFPNNKINFIKGLEVLSIEWPIGKDKKNGKVQVDFFPVYDKNWSAFIYKYPTDSKYKSAHRNWLFMAVLSTIKTDIEKAETGEELSYDGYMMNLNKGLFSIKKDYQGKTKILKHGEIVEEKLVTTDPNKFVEFIFGKGYKPEDVRTFEACWHIINKKDFKWHDNLGEIKKNLKKFLERVKLPIPKQLS